MSSARAIEFAAAALLVVTCMRVDAADMRQITENMDRIMASGEVRRAYVEPLQLKGKDFRQVLGILVGEGFRCAAKDGPPDLMDLSKYLPAALACQKEGTSIHKLCEILRVDVLPPDAMIKGAELLRAFDDVTAKQVGTFCLAKPRVPAETRDKVEQNRPAAETRLAQRMKPFNSPDKTGAQAFYELLGRGYACGVEPNEIVCTLRSPDAWCVQEKTVIALERSTPTPAAKAFDDLDKTVVRNQKNSCELPY